MTWRDFVAPVSASMSAILEADVHLVVSCSWCGRSVRMTPTEAAEQMGIDCTFDQARDRFRCSWCGSRGRNLVEVRPCSEDVAAKRRIFDAEHRVRLWPEEAASRRALEEARAEWARRRPRDSMDAMCNAFRLRTPIAQIARDLERLDLPVLFPGGATPNDWPEIEMTRPTNVLPVFRPADAMDPDAGLQLANKRWWMVPFFHRGETKAWKAMCTNARAETVATSRTFKAAFERRRCLVPADAYYEWTGEPGSRQRWRFERPDGDWWSFAGVWDRAETTEGVLESFAIVTTDAGLDARDVHTRQPVILEKPDFGRWLDLSSDVADLLRPSPLGSLVKSAA